MGYVERFSTDGLAENARVDFWNGLASQTFTALTIDPAERSGFRGELTRVQSGDFGMALATSSSAEVKRVPRPFDAGEPEHALFLHLQLKGASRCAQDGREAELGFGDIAVCDSARPYRLALSENNEMLVVKLPGDRALGRAPATPALTGHRLAADGARSGLLSRFLGQAWASIEAGVGDAAWSQAVCEATLALLDLAVSDPDAEEGVRARLRRRACELIERELCDPDLNTAFVAQALGVTPRYLQMAFADVGLTASDHIRARRLELARRRLRPERSVTEVAYELGFGDLTYFSRTFRRRFGVTPSAWRARGGAG